jgi:hypothetical protein
MVKQGENEREVAGRFGRRSWLRTAIAGGVISAFGGAIALVRTSGYTIDPGAAARLSVFRPWQYAVARAVARRLAAPDRAEGVVSADDVGVAEFIDAYLVDVPGELRGDLFRLLRYVEQLAPLGAGFFHRFTDLGEADQDQVLAGLETSRIDALRAGFQAMKSLVMMGYYRDPRTFGMLGYPGPLLTREPAP